MKNLQLNNTSVYLGGQCKWDIVLGQHDGQLYIQGFQLSPLSHNVPFNKKGTVDIVNHDHSYTLKTFCENIKENFWSNDPCLDMPYVCSGSKGYFDNSFYYGLKRSPSYSVYNKQFEYLQPLWLEQLSEDQPLQFTFYTYPSGAAEREGKRPLNRRVLVIEEKEDNDLYKFHNQFITYFNNWLKYLGIMSEKGNDRCLYVDIRNQNSMIDGVSIISGQKTDKIECHYLWNNLLSYERPNIETDYILSSLFRTHNAVAAQLFNLNFCFNPADIFDSFVVNQLSGQYINIDCEVSVGGEDLDKRSIFTNYEFIQKETYNPFIFMSDVITPVSGNDLPGRQLDGYDVKYEYNGIDVDNINVLDYLRDYNNSQIRSANKLTQPIIHWGYSWDDPNTFNLYGGYAPVNVSQLDPNDSTSIVRTEGTGDTKPYYECQLFKINNVNGLFIPYLNSSYTHTNGGLNWIYPVKVMYFNDDSLNKFLDFMNFFGWDGLQDKYIWNIEKSFLNKYVGNDDLSDLNISFVYVNSGNISTYVQKVTNNRNPDYSWSLLYNDNPANVYIYKSTVKSTNYLILTKQTKWFSIYDLLNIDNTGYPDLGDFQTQLQKVNQCIQKYDDEFDFYGFGTEIVIGRNELGDECYYKSPDRKTFVYRKCGQLTPFTINDEDKNENYYYYNESSTQDIKKIDDINESIEDYSYENEKLLVMIPTLRFTLYKNVDDQQSVKDMIKDKLAEIYGINRAEEMEKVDYIYKLYDVNYKFEYATDDSLDKVEYIVTMKLI